MSEKMLKYGRRLKYKVIEQSAAMEAIGKYCVDPSGRVWRTDGTRLCELANYTAVIDTNTFDCKNRAIHEYDLLESITSNELFAVVYDAPTFVLVGRDGKALCTLSKENSDLQIVGNLYVAKDWLPMSQLTAKQIAPISELKGGWIWPKHLPKAHYFVTEGYGYGASLCGKHVFVIRDAEIDKNDSPDNCATCMKRLAIREKRGSGKRRSKKVKSV